MIQKIMELAKKYRELITYVIFGVLTTIVDFGSYLILTRFLAVNEDISNVIAQILAIIFAFITNKLFVFEDKNMKAINVLLQFFKFTSLRLVTLFINSALFTLLVHTLKINDIITKIIVSFIVIVLNYIFSKLIIFRKKG